MNFAVNVVNRFDSKKATSFSGANNWNQFEKKLKNGGRLTKDKGTVPFLRQRKWRRIIVFEVLLSSIVLVQFLLQKNTIFCRDAIDVTFI